MASWDYRLHTETAIYLLDASGHTGRALDSKSGNNVI